MSMISEFREITPDFLERMKSNPSLAEAVILGPRAPQTPQSDLDVVLAAIPTRQREELKKALESMPPERRELIVAQAAQAAGALLQGLAGLRESAGVPALDPADLGEHLDIQKAWHGVHFLLSGSADATPDPLGQAILGGTEIGNDTGYGPPRYLDSAAVANVAAALEKLGVDDLRGRYNADRMEAAQVYPGGWDDEENLEWIVDAYGDVATFYKGVASRGNAVLLYLT